MDNRKIGNLIAELRKKQGLTQQDLGDKVGVGFRAVSKWERGITLPDISIINDLSKILGISSDELLTGKLNKENKSETKKKFPKGIKITISIITAILIIVTSILIYTNNKTYVYDIKKVDGADYYIEGKVTFQNKKISIIVNKLYFDNQQLNSLLIKDYEFDIYSMNQHIFGYSREPNGKIIENNIRIDEFMKKFHINYEGETSLNRKNIIYNNLVITFKFRDIKNNVIDKKIEIILVETNKR